MLQQMREGGGAPALGQRAHRLIRRVGLDEAKELRHVRRLAQGELRAQTVLGSVGQLIAADAGAPGDRPGLGVVGDGGRGQVVVVARDLAEQHGPARGFRCDHDIARLHVVRELVQAIGDLAKLAPTVLWPGSCHSATDRLEGQPGEIAGRSPPKERGAALHEDGGMHAAFTRSHHPHRGLAAVTTLDGGDGAHVGEPVQEGRAVPLQRVGVHRAGVGCEKGPSRSSQRDDAGVRVVDEPCFRQVGACPAEPVVDDRLSARQATLADLVVEMERIGDRLHEVCEGMRLAIRQRLQHGAEEVIHGRHADRRFGGVTAALQGFGLVDVGFSRASLDEALKAFVPSQDRVVDALRVGREEPPALVGDAPDAATGTVGQTRLREIGHRPVGTARDELDALVADELLALLRRQLELGGQRVNDRARQYGRPRRRGSAAPGA